MKIISPSHNYMPHDCTPVQFIEKVGRICYKSTDKITDDSAVQFVKNLINRNHWAMLEHETVYINTSVDHIEWLKREIEHSGWTTKYINISLDVRPENKPGLAVLSGSFRAFYDIFTHGINKYPVITMFANLLREKYPEIYYGLNINSLPNCYDTFCDTTKILSRDEFITEYDDKPEILFKHLTHTVLFVCDRGVSHELVRHRPCAFGQESTRYCNYSKDKFDKQITVILPCFYDTATENVQYETWKHSCEVAEYAYFKLLNYGSTPQEARDVLPTSLKTEIVITTTEEEWQHIVNLRSKGTTGAPHPQMVEIMTPCFEELKNITNNRIH